MYQRGDIVVVPFPFADTSDVKKRPALIISNDKVNSTGDYLMIQITTKEKKDKLSLPLSVNDFKDSPLPLKSFIRCHKIFLLNEKIILYKKTSIKNSFIAQLIQKIISLLN